MPFNKPLVKAGQLKDIWPVFSSFQNENVCLISFLSSWVAQYVGFSIMTPEI